MAKLFRTSVFASSLVACAAFVLPCILLAQKATPAHSSARTTRSSAAHTAAETTPAIPAGPAVAPTTHKIYIDTVNNKLWWPLDKPFWVRLATSPEADAPSYLLQRAAPETDAPSREGIDVPMSGKQYLRWYNAATKQTVSLLFFTDGEPPITKATCTGAPTSVEGTTTFYGKGLLCSLAAVDELSGVDKMYLSVNEAAYQPYSNTIGLNKEGTVILHYYSVDHVGYLEKPTGMRFVVDLTPPTTTDVITGNAIGDVLSTQAKFRISSSDKLSGVEHIQARFDQQDYKLLSSGELEVAALGDGEHTLSYYAVDKVSNRETEHNVPFYLDRTPPVVTPAIVGDQFLSPSGTRFVSNRSQIGLTAVDNKSGVARIEYSFEGPAFNTFNRPVLLPNKVGAGKVTYRATDKLGNASTPGALAYTMDTAPPQSSYHINGATYQVRSDVYITSKTSIELSATDDASGVQSIEYQPEGAAQALPYNAPLTFPEEGRRLVRFWSTDRVNNRELDRAVLVITDDTPPQIFANFSVKAISPATAQSPAVYRRLTSLFLGATDNAAGVHKIYYSFDGGKESEYSTPLVLDHIGTFNLLIRVDDNLGNQTSQHLKFVIQ